MKPALYLELLILLLSLSVLAVLRSKYKKGGHDNKTWILDIFNLRQPLPFV